MNAAMINIAFDFDEWIDISPPRSPFVSDAHFFTPLSSLGGAIDEDHLIENIIDDLNGSRNEGGGNDEDKHEDITSYISPLNLLDILELCEDLVIMPSQKRSRKEKNELVKEEEIIPIKTVDLGCENDEFDLMSSSSGTWIRQSNDDHDYLKILGRNDIKTEGTRLQSELDSLLNKKRRNTMGRLKKNMSTESIIDDMSHIESSVYSLSVCEPKHYTDKKRAERRKCTNMVRMLAGIPFAVLYGAFLYLLLRFIILSDPREHVLATRSNNTNSSDYNDTSRINHQKWRGKQTVYFGGKHHSELVYLSTGFTVALGVTSIFSRGTRCSMLLILPCIITGRSRTILFTFILGLLVDGPIESLVHNFNEITKNTACVYGALARMAHSSLLKLNRIFGIVTKLKRATINPFGSFIFLPGTSMTTSAPSSNLTFPRISAIRKQIIMVKNGINEARQYTSILRKTLTILSIFMMVVDAIRYLRSYYSDNSFDNRYINRNVRHFWKRKGYEGITPLRRWEQKEGFKSSSGQCSGNEVRKNIRKIVRCIIPTLVFSIVVCLTMLSDHLLATVIQSIKDKEDIKISISMKDIEKEFAEAIQLILDKFYKKTESCEVHPLITSINKYILICVFLLVAALSCGCEILFSRMRSRMCNIFYNHRARERADYLHYRIIAGRINRRIQLRLIIRRELERRERLEEFFPWPKLSKLCCKKSKHFKCLGCGWEEEKDNSKTARYKLGNTEINANICMDCYKDFKMVCNHTGSNHVRESYFVMSDNEGNLKPKE